MPDEPQYREEIDLDEEDERILAEVWADVRAGKLPPESPPLAGDVKDAVLQAMLDNPEKANEIAEFASDPNNLKGLTEPPATTK